jgi:hypothetical protein
MPRRQRVLSPCHKLAFEYLRSAWHLPLSPYQRMMCSATVPLPAAYRKLGPTLEGETDQAHRVRESLVAISAGQQKQISGASAQSVERARVRATGAQIMGRVGTILKGYAPSSSVSFTDVSSPSVLSHPRSSSSSSSGLMLSPSGLILMLRCGPQPWLSDAQKVRQPASALALLCARPGDAVCSLFQGRRMEGNKQKAAQLVEISICVQGPVSSACLTRSNSLNTVTTRK